MNGEVYILTIVKEIEAEIPEVITFAFGNNKTAFDAYCIYVDYARCEAENYESAHEEEISSDTYGHYRINDASGANAITVELQLKSVIGEYEDMAF